MTNVSQDTDVLGRARAGDERAFLALYRAAQPGLLRYLSVLVGAEAEEVAARTWVQVSNELARFTGSLDEFRAWVAGIGRTLAHESIDRAAAVGLTTEPIDVVGGPTPPRAARALQAISELPRPEAEAITLRAVMGMGEAEAAGVLGMGRTALRRTAERGLRALIRRLEPVPAATSEELSVVDSIVDLPDERRARPGSPSGPSHRLDGDRVRVRRLNGVDLGSPQADQSGIEVAR